MNLTTFSGRSINLDSISPEDINFNDIAHALSHICRFTGHTPYPYSVARHSILTLDIAVVLDAEQNPADGGVNMPISAHALLHDTPEYLLNDTARPVKTRPEVQAPIAAIERRVLEAIYGAARMSLPQPEQVRRVKLVDDVALEIERRFFFPWTDNDGWSAPNIVSLANRIMRESPHVLEHVRLPRTPQEDRHAMGMAMLQHAVRFGETDGEAMQVLNTAKRGA